MRRLPHSDSPCCLQCCLRCCCSPCSQVLNAPPRSTSVSSAALADSSAAPRRREHTRTSWFSSKRSYSLRIGTGGVQILICFFQCSGAWTFPPTDPESPEEAPVSTLAIQPLFPSRLAWRQVITYLKYRHLHAGRLSERSRHHSRRVRPFHKLGRRFWRSSLSLGLRPGYPRTTEPSLAPTSGVDLKSVEFSHCRFTARGNPKPWSPFHREVRHVGRGANVPRP